VPYVHKNYTTEQDHWPLAPISHDHKCGFCASPVVWIPTRITLVRRVWYDIYDEDYLLIRRTSEEV
jgi:hypothetical protein